MDRIEITQEILLLQGAFSTHAHLHLNLDGSDSIALRKGALIIVKTIREIERINARKPKQQINESLHFAILSRTIFSNWNQSIDILPPEDELSESSKVALPYTVPWPLYFECVRFAHWESFLEKAWKSFRTEILFEICAKALDYAIIYSEDHQIFSFVCCVYCIALSQEAHVDAAVSIIKTCNCFLKPFFNKLLHLPSAQRASATLQTFRTLSRVLDTTRVRGFHVAFAFWCEWTQAVILSQGLSTDSGKEETENLAFQCGRQLDAIVARPNDFGDETVRVAASCSKALCDSGLVSREAESHLARYISDVRSQNCFWKDSLEKLLQRPDAFTNSQIASVIDSTTLEPEQAMAFAHNLRMDHIFAIVKKSLARWPPNDKDRFISAHYADGPLALGNNTEEYETELTTFFNRLSTSCSEMDPKNTAAFSELCFVDAAASITRLLRFALDCGRGELVVWLMSNYPLLCCLKTAQNQTGLLGQCFEVVLFDADLTNGQEDNLKPVLRFVTQSTEAKTTFVECFRSFFFDVLLKPLPENANRRALCVMQTFYDVIEDSCIHSLNPEYDPICILLYFCQMLHCNLRVQRSRIDAKSLADKQDIIAMMNRTTISVVSRHALSQVDSDHVLHWFSHELNQLDPRVSYYLVGFFQENAQDARLLRFSDFSHLSIASLISLACFSPSSFVFAHVTRRLSASQNAYWELCVSVLNLLPNLTACEWKSMLSLLSECFSSVPKMKVDAVAKFQDGNLSTLGLLTDAMLILTKPSYLTQECSVNLIQNYACSTLELIQNLGDDDDAAFLQVFFDSCRLLKQLPDHLRPFAKRSVLELSTRVSQSLRPVVDVALRSLDVESQDTEHILRVFRQK